MSRKKLKTTKNIFLNNFVILIPLYREFVKDKALLLNKIL